MQMRRRADARSRIRADARGGVADAGDVHRSPDLEAGDVGADRFDFAGAVLIRALAAAAACARRCPVRM